MDNSETNALVAKIDAYYDRKVELIRKHNNGGLSTLEYNALMDELEESTSFMDTREGGEDEFNDQQT